MQDIHVERLRTLYSVIAGIPKQVIEMDSWRSGWYDESSDKAFIEDAVFQINAGTARHCGTGACALGWACAYPEFKKHGLKYKNGEPTFTGVKLDSWGDSDGFEVGSKFFGISYSEANELFNGVYSNPRYHKGVFLTRLRNLLVKKNIITKERAKELKAQEPLYN